jgi:hypothetical protein
LRTEYPTEGAFIKEGAYRPADTVSIPDLSTIAQESLEYEGAKALYLDEVKYAAKKRRQIIEKRVEMYCKMYNAIGTTARAEIATNPSFEDLHEENADPIALWKLIHVLLPRKRRVAGGLPPRSAGEGRTTREYRRNRTPRC